MNCKTVIVLKNFVDVKEGSFIKNQRIEISEDIADRWIEGNLVAECIEDVKPKKAKSKKQKQE